MRSSIYCTRRNVPFAIRQLVNSVYCSTAATSTKSVEKPEQKKPKKDDWKTNLLKKLDEEYKEQGRRFKEEKTRKAAQAQIMRYTIKDDMRSLFRFVDSQKRSRNALKMREDDELLAMSLLVFHKKFSSMIASTEVVNSTDSLAMFLDLNSVWSKVRRLSNDGAAAAMLVMSTIRHWQSQRRQDDKSSTVNVMCDDMEMSLSRAVQNFRLHECHMYLSAEDRKTVEREWRRLDGKEARERIEERQQGSRYDERLSLVEPLQEAVDAEHYGDNPFRLNNVDENVYTSKFGEHMKLEAATWLHVPNTVGRSEKPEMHGEQVIEEWKWREKIEKTLAAMDPNKMQTVVASCLEVIPRDRLVDLLLHAAMAVCSQGQNLVSASIFHYDLVSPVMRELQEMFKKGFGYDEKQAWNKVFEEYSLYFVNAEKAREKTHREWWDEVCRKNNVYPDYLFPMGEIDSTTRQEMANVFSDIVIRSCVFPVTKKDKVSWLPAFSYRSVSVEEESRVAQGGRLSLSRMLALHPKLVAEFEKSPFEFILFSTQQLPMTVPPRPWIDFGVGGPLYTQRSEIIRNVYEFKVVDVNRETKKRIRTAKHARPVFDALNQLGSTPWVINEKMLDVLRKVFALSGDSSSHDLLETLGVPARADTIKVPNYVEEFGEGVRKEDIEQGKWREYGKKKAEAVKLRNECNSLWCWMLYRVVLAEHYRGQVLFFPHNMDFRGRVYPLSPYLSHMGDDVNRCILKFAKAKRLGSDGLQWLKLHCINLTGKLKRASVADRLVEAERVLPAIIDSANNPLGGDGWWKESEEPWQTLAACIEIRDALAFGSDGALFPSQLPVHQDGSCNGLQHYAALGRDNEGGTQVNLTSSELPNDVYSDVAQRVEQKRKEDESGGQDMEVAKKLRESLPQDVPRKVIKQTVMTTVYGVTMYGAVQQIKRQLRALGIGNDDSALFARYLARKTFASLNDAFTSSMMLKDWFRECAKATSELMRTVEWVTPLGLPVVQPYLKAVDKKGKLVLAPISTKQVDAFPPNFVHSLDSTHMMLTSLHCAARGITFAAVHDCFWTHAASVDKMNEICRQQFVALHKLPIVQQCSEWFNTRYLPLSVTKNMSKEELEKYQDIFTPKAKPGSLDIEEVKKSVYFFS